MLPIDQYVSMPSLAAFVPRRTGVLWMLLLLLGKWGHAQVITNGSFEHGQTGAGMVPEGWEVIAGSPELQAIDGSGLGIYALEEAAANGDTYLGLLTNHAGLEDALGQSVELRAQTDYSGHVQLFAGHHHPAWTGIARLQIWAGAHRNAVNDLLWESQPVMNEHSWLEYAIHFMPLTDYGYLVLRVVLEEGSGTYSYLLVDDLALNPTLAVGLQEFAAASTEAGVRLQWETEVLTGGEIFTAEYARSQAPDQFETIETIEAAAGDHLFQLMHVSPPVGDLLYRLRMRDANGAVSTSEVIHISRNEPGSYRVFKNQGNCTMHILGPANDR